MGNRLINKPIRGASVNTSHPLSRNLVHGLPYNEYSGSPVNLFTQQVLTATTANIYWDMYGYYYGYDGAYLWEANASQHNIPSSAITMYNFFGYLGTHTSSAGPVFKAHGSLVSYGIVFESVANSGKIQFHTEISSTARSTPLTSSAISSTSGSHIFGWWESGTPLYLEVIDIYGNLVYATESASSYSGIITYGTDAMYYGYNTTGISVADYTWSRALTASERMQVATDPWCMYRQPSKTMHFVPAPKKGLWVVDSHIPQSIDAGGFASDGAFHIDVDINQDAIIEIDTDRDDPSFVVHDPSIMTGSVVGPTEHLLVHWDCDSTTLDIFDATDGSTVGGTTDFTDDGIRGKGSTHADPNQVYITATDGSNINFTEGTITLRCKSLNTNNGGKSLFQLGNDYEQLQLLQRGSTSSYSCAFRIAGDNVDDEFGPATTNSTGLNDGNWHTVTAIWSQTYSIKSVIIDSDIYLMNDTVGTPVPTVNDRLYIGSNETNTEAYEGIIDNFKIYDAPILPYGSFVSGQQVDSGDYSKAHSDITAYVHGSSLKIGIGDLTLGGATTITGPDGSSTSALAISGSDLPYIPADNINPTRGSIAFWYKKTGTIAGWARLFSIGGSTTIFRLERDSTSNDEFKFYVSGTLASFETNIDFWDGNWHYMRLTWDADKNERTLFQDGYLDPQIETTAFDAPDFDGTSLYIGSDTEETNTCEGSMYGLTITNNLNTPELPFVLGHGPVCVPTVENSKKVS